VRPEISERSFEEVIECGLPARSGRLRRRRDGSARYAAAVWRPVVKEEFLKRVSAEIGRRGALRHRFTPTH
jgi:hypothetical protein